MRYYFLLFFILLFARCNGDDPFVSTVELKDKWELVETIAPNYPLVAMVDTNDIFISFPKNEEYELELSTFSCTGTYLAKQSGSMAFKRSNCSEVCCMSDYDLYIFTLLKKVNTYTYSPEESLQLTIDKDNYLKFIYKESTSVF